MSGLLETVLMSSNSDIVSSVFVMNSYCCNVTLKWISVTLDLNKFKVFYNKKKTEKLVTFYIFGKSCVMFLFVVQFVLGDLWNG